MCGFTGWYNPKENLLKKKKIIKKMNKTLKYRGPDQTGYYYDKNLLLGHQRLSIIDLKNGKQPMNYKNYTIVYNGEIYNTCELRDDLIEKGYVFLTNSDTEVILKGYVQYKEKIIEKMLQNFIDELDYIPLKEMPSDIFDEANYGGYYNSYVSDDYFEGKINNQNIKMADLLVQRITVEKDKDGNEEKKVMTIFGILFGKIELEKSINSNLNITRDYSSSIKKTQKLEMDSYGFEKIFNVYTDNNIIAMQLLTSDIQEGLLDIYNKYKIDFHIIIKQNKMYVLFDTESMFEVFSTKDNPSEVLKKYFEIMTFIYILIEKILKTIESTQI